MPFEPKDIGKRIEGAVEEELAVIGLEVVADAVEFLNTPGDDGRIISMDGSLAGSMISETENEDGFVSVEIGPTAHYGLYRHEGTRPHWAPIEPLRYWVQKKLGITGEKDINSVARAVQVKIATKGTEGKPFLTTPFERHKGTVAKRIGRAIEDVIGGQPDAG